MQDLIINFSSISKKWARAPTKQSAQLPEANWDLEAEPPELGELLQIFSKNKEF